MAIRLRFMARFTSSFPLPIEMVGTISVAPNNQIQVHVTKLNVLKIPLKGLLGGFTSNSADLFQSEGIPGIQVTGTTLFSTP